MKINSNRIAINETGKRKGLGTPQIASQQTFTEHLLHARH